MAKLTVKRNVLVPVAAPVTLYLTGCLIAVLLAVFSDDVWQPILFMTGGMAALLAWRLMRWSDPWARYFSFGAVLLLACALNRAFYIADYLLSGTRFHEWPFYASSPQFAVFKAEFMTVVGTLLTVLFWKLSGGAKVSPWIVKENSGSSFRVMVVAYSFSLISMILAELQPQFAASLGQLLPTLLGIGLISSYLIPLTRSRNAHARLLIVSILSIPFVVLASGTGMKENLILALLPMAISAWQRFRGLVFRGAMIIVALLVLGMITSYVNFYRDEVWIGHSNAQTDRVLEDFVQQVENDGVEVTLGKSIPQFIGRSNASVHHGWAVAIADDRGYEPNLIFSPMIYVFVPRMIWPEKPLIRQGWEFSGMVFGTHYTTWSDSSTAAGLYPSLYLGGGWFSVICGAMVLGVLLGKLSLLSYRAGGSVAAGLFLLSMLPFVLRLDETWTAGAFSGPIISCVYVLAVTMVSRILGSAFLNLRRRTT